MPPRTAKAKAAPAPEPAEIDGKDYSSYIEKEPTPTQARMIEWLKGDDVGYDPATAKTKAEAFEQGAKLVFALRMEFQRSPFNQEFLEERRAELEAAKSETKAAAPKKTRVTRKAKAEEPEPEEDEEDDLVEDEEEDIVEDEEEETPPPAPKRATRTTRAAAAKAPAAPAAPKRATRASRAKASNAAPF
jgi:hypothetical protein